MPAAWTDAHHVTHWIDGGATSLDNLTLLCRRHHTHVHRHDLTATVTPTGVTWNTWQQWRRDWRGRGRPAPDPQTPSPDGRLGDHAAATDLWTPSGTAGPSQPDRAGVGSRAGPD